MYYTYILTNFNNKTLYIGFTGSLVRRSFQHKKQFVNSFTSRYKIYKLVYYEQFEDPRLARRREAQLKRWHRDWKINLITSFNPTWRDLYNEIGFYNPS